MPDRDATTTRLLAIVFTDVVGSTAARQALGDRAYAEAIREHHALVRRALDEVGGGEEIETAGDSFLLAFETPSDAMRFALAARAALRVWNRGRAVPLVDRFGVHLGEVVVHDRGRRRELYSLALDVGARVMGLGDGDRILCTRAVFDAARQHLENTDGSLAWWNHGRYLLKGVEGPVEICELAATGDGPRQPPPDSEKARRAADDEQPVVSGWRPAQGAVVPGTPYVLERVLGQGSVGEAWVGKHRTLRSLRVFKFCFDVVRARSLRREVALFRVLQERVGAHPHLVRLHDVRLDAPPYYLVTDYAEGRDLLAFWEERRGAFPLAARLEVVAQIALALQAAHDVGILHRDVKPANVLVEEREGSVHARLLDFGIGQVLSEDVLAGLTRTGLPETMVATAGSSSTTGTLLYLAPEVLTGAAATPRSDTFSLGVVLWQLIVDDLRRALPPDWERTVDDELLRDDLHRCFAGDPAARFSGVAELARNLRDLPARRAEVELRRAEALVRERAAARRATVRAVAVAGALVAVFAGLAALAWTEARRAEVALAEAEARRDEARRARDLAELEAVSALAAAREAAGRPDEALALFRAAVVLSGDTAITPLGADLLRVFNDRGGAFVRTGAVALRSAGDWGLALDGRRVQRWTPTTGARDLLLEAPFDIDRYFLDDEEGRFALSDGRGRVLVYDVASGRTTEVDVGEPVKWISVYGRALTLGAPDDRKVTILDAETGVLRGAVAVPPFHRAKPALDGSRLLTTHRPERRMVLWDVERGTPIATIEDAILPDTIGTDERRFVVARDGGRVEIRDLERGAVLHTLRETLDVTGAVDRVGARGFTPDGSKIAVATSTHSVRLIDPTGQTAPVTFVGGAPAKFSPNGERLLLAHEDGRSVVAYDVRRPQGPRFTIEGDASPAYGWFGGRTAVTTMGVQRIWSTPPARDPVFVPVGRDVDTFAWSPDGSAFAVDTEDGSIEVWDLEDRTPTRRFRVAVATGRMDQLAFSIDATRVYAVSPVVAAGKEPPPGAAPMTRGAQLFSVSASDGAVMELLATTHPPSLDGHLGALAPGPAGRVAWGLQDGRVRLFAGPSGPPEVVLELGYPIYALAWSPDGATIAVGVRGDDEVVLADTSTGQVLARLPGHTDWVRILGFSPDGLRLASLDAKGIGRLFEIATGRSVQVVGTLSRWGAGVDFGEDGRLRTGVRDRDHPMWLREGEVWNTWSRQRPYVRTLSNRAFDPTRSFLLQDGRTLWHVPTQRAVADLGLGREGPTFAESFTADGEWLAVATDEVTLWDDLALDVPGALRRSGALTNLRVCPRTHEVVPVVPQPGPDSVFAPAEACAAPVLPPSRDVPEPDTSAR